ncbi:MAG TPA: pyruvate kinase [Clostridia bacterium]|nr:pyruvate kinase [Clostridia bacterium]HRX41853.1 pyruvate kinase [Clostridia bacterium]
MRKTKIICTMGPATEGRCEELILNGMDAARFNFSHENYEIHGRRIRELKEARERLKVPVAMIIDTKGPEMRIGVLKKKFDLKKDTRIRLVVEDIEGDENAVSITNKMLYEKVSPGQSIFIDDGRIELAVIEIIGTDIVCSVISGGPLSSRKGVNVPDCDTGLPFMTEKDIQDIEFGIENDFDYVALSFVHSAADIYKVRGILKKKYREDIKIIAKIENREAVNNIDEIIEAADSIMIARGDMGIELPLSQVPVIQKRLIKKCYSSAKPVIVATQMLESMTENPLPTRAEVSDVANAIYDGTSVVMLSGETAAGDFPIKSLQTMARVVEDTEADIDYESRFAIENFDMIEKNALNIISKAAVMTAFEIKAKAIVMPTRTGNSARMVSSFRPSTPIIAITMKPTIQRQLNMSWNIRPMLSEFIGDQKQLFENVMNKACETKLVEEDDQVIMIAGIPTGSSGKTNMMKIHKVGEAVVGD